MRAWVAVIAACAVFCVPVGFAQQPAYAPPRTADGHPDFGGVWSNDGGPERIVGPADGKLPFRDRKATMAWRDKYAIYMTGKPTPEFTLGPDTLPNRDRCLMAANAAAPPMTSQGYNDAYQFVQTPAFMAIGIEMMDEMRIIPVFGAKAEAQKAHQPPVLQRWTGDPVGWWEGDAFVVETRSVSIKQGSQAPFAISPDGVVLERFTRVGDDEIAYEAEVTDLSIYTRPWKLQTKFERTGGRLWEYACHEGNYDVAGILEEARRREARNAGGKR